MVLRNFHFRNIRPIAVTLLTLGILGCAIKSPVGSNSKELSAIDPANREEEQLREFAAAFDRFISKDMSETERISLLDTCHTTNGSNPFCDSVINYSSLVREPRRQTLQLPMKPVRPVYPIFKKGRIKNWLELRYSQVNELVKGIPRANAYELHQLELLALKERRCPNNIAIAVATQLEDQLPDPKLTSHIARLYEKGASCLKASNTDRSSFYLRAGLFHFSRKQFRRASKLFASSSTMGINGSRALYWLYRSRLSLADKNGADLALTELKSKHPFSLHTIIALASEDKEPDDILSGKSVQPLKRSRQHEKVNTLIEQVEILRRFGFERTAAKVLDWAIRVSRKAEPEFQLYLAEIKAEQGDYHTKIKLLTRVLAENPKLISRQTMELFFPKAYFPIFEKNSSGLDPYLLLAIARQESAFNPDAVSRANARGLLQILPQTAKRFLKDGAEDFQGPDENITVGANYFTELLQSLGGQLHLALAAYNAGPSKISEWTRRYPAEDPILFTDLLPFKETRDYVSLILRNYYWYRRIHYPLSPGLPWNGNQMKTHAPKKTDKKVSRLKISRNKKRRG